MDPFLPERAEYDDFSSLYLIHCRFWQRLAVGEIGDATTVLNGGEDETSDGKLAVHDGHGLDDDCANIDWVFV